jgi:hypothetical protein
MLIFILTILSLFILKYSIRGVPEIGKIPLMKLAA